MLKTKYDVDKIKGQQWDIIINKKLLLIKI